MAPCRHGARALRHRRVHFGAVRRKSRGGRRPRGPARRRLDEPGREPPIAGLFDALALPEGDMYRAGDFYVLVEAPDHLTVENLAPEFDKLRDLSDVRAVIVTARADDGVHSIVSRVFGPAVGIDEDPATG